MEKVCPIPFAPTPGTTVELDSFETCGFDDLAIGCEGYKNIGVACAAPSDCSGGSVCMPDPNGAVDQYYCTYSCSLDQCPAGMSCKGGYCYR